MRLLAGRFIAETGKQREQLLASRLKLAYARRVDSGNKRNNKAPREKRIRSAHVAKSVQPVFRDFNQETWAKNARIAIVNGSKVPPEDIAQQPDLMLHLGQ